MKLQSERERERGGKEVVVVVVVVVKVRGGLVEACVAVAVPLSASYRLAGIQVFAYPGS